MNVKSMYNELLFTSLSLNFVDSFLTFIAVFCCGYLIVYFYKFSIWFAVLAGFIFFLRSIYFKLKQNKILFLEKKYPQLKERLRTSYDYQEQNNTVINDLHSDILALIQKVDVNTFLDAKVLVIKVIVILAMLMSTLILSSYGFDVYDIRRAIVNSDFYRGASGFVADMFDKPETANRPLLDKPEIKDSGNKEVNISIDTFNTELDTDNIKDPEKNDYGGNYPDEVSGAAQEVYEEKIPEEYKDAVKEYFKKINE